MKAKNIKSQEGLLFFFHVFFHFTFFFFAPISKKSLAKKKDASFLYSFSFTLLSIHARHIFAFCFTSLKQTKQQYTTIKPTNSQKLPINNMKFILAPLVAIATFASLVAAAAPDNEKTIEYSKYAIKGPVSDIYAYWPDKKDSDPDTRVVELLMPSTGRTFPYRLHYKDPKDNKYDLSVAEDAEEALAAAEDDGPAIGKITGAEFAALDLDSKVMMSVYLDKDDKVVYMAQDVTVPTSYNDMLVHQEAYIRHLHHKLGPNTPGIEVLKDSGSIVAQALLFVFFLSVLPFFFPRSF